MTIRHLKIFIAVYQAQSVTRASEALHMTQPAVTRAVQEMERYYGARLFERMNRRLYATETAKALYSRALHITDSFDAMEKELRNRDGAGALRVGASITLGNFLLPGLAAAFQERRPGFKVYVSVSNAALLFQSLIHNRLDLALIEGEVSQPQLRWEPFARDRLILILPPRHPLLGKDRLRLKDVAGCPLLLREKGSVGRALVDHVFALNGLSAQPLWESASTQALVKAVGAGLGVSLLPEQLVRDDISAGKIAAREIEDAAFERTHAIVWHQDKYLTRAAQDFMDLCRHLGARDGAEP